MEASDADSIAVIGPPERRPPSVQADGRRRRRRTRRDRAPHRHEPTSTYSGLHGMPNTKPGVVAGRGHGRPRGPTTSDDAKATIETAAIDSSDGVRTYPTHRGITLARQARFIRACVSTRRNELRP
jgi:hypothetical protein